MRLLQEMDEDTDVTIDPLVDGGGSLSNEPIQDPNE